MMWYKIKMSSLLAVAAVAVAAETAVQIKNDTVHCQVIIHGNNIIKVCVQASYHYYFLGNIAVNI